MFDEIEKDIEQNAARQMFLQYGTPTITFSSEKLQLTSLDEDKADFVVSDDSFEILIGDK